MKLRETSEILSAVFNILFRVIFGWAVAIKESMQVGQDSIV